MPLESPASFHSPSSYPTHKQPHRSLPRRPHIPGTLSLAPECKCRRRQIQRALMGGCAAVLQTACTGPAAGWHLPHGQPAESERHDDCPCAPLWAQVESGAGRTWGEPPVHVSSLLQASNFALFCRFNRDIRFIACLKVSLGSSAFASAKKMPPVDLLSLPSGSGIPPWF